MVASSRLEANGAGFLSERRNKKCRGKCQSGKIESGTGESVSLPYIQQYLCAKRDYFFSAALKLSHLKAAVGAEVAEAL